MSARGFRPVGWVAAVGGAALGCYMLSLNVAAERAELAKIERQIIAAKQDIRDLETELGTRGRLAQLENWNADVLALSAPASKQFLEDEFRLASFSAPARNIDEESARVRMASAEAADRPAAKPAIVTRFEENAGDAGRPVLRRASLVIGGAAEETSAAKTRKPPSAEPKKAPAAAPAKPIAAARGVQKPVKADSGLIDSSLIAEISAVAKAEKKQGAADTR